MKTKQKRERPEQLEEPIREVTVAIGRSIQQAINQGKEAGRWGFFLAVYRHGDEGRFNYVSNSQRNDVVKLLREMAEKFENDPEGMQ